MINYVDEEVGVITVYNAKTHTIKPVVMQWNGKRYTIERVAFYHPVRKGGCFITSIRSPMARWTIGSTSTPRISSGT